jgi:hypothetical protein
MSKSFVVSMIAACMFGNGAFSQSPDPGDQCTYSVTTNGPTWGKDSMLRSTDVVANAWARDGAYGGNGHSRAEALAPGGAAVAVASVAYWFKVTHHAEATCNPVKFESEAKITADVGTSITGDSDDYALAAGFQAVTGYALHPATMAVAATNAGSPVQDSTVAITIGPVGFTLTIPGVSVTADTIDRDAKTTFTSGTATIEEEQITVNCWTKIKVVTDGPFGGVAHASVNTTEVSAKTTSTCKVHDETGTFVHEVSES